MLRPPLLAGTAALFLAAPALAQNDTARPQESYNSETAKDFNVSGAFQRNSQDILSGTSVRTGTELTRQLKPTIGETLANQPGVSATSFGPNASRPVLRGFQGERVRVLTDGIGSFDVSNTSVDHAVVINPLTADRIEVLRGPYALLYGSAAIGGVVNVIDSRIPRGVHDETIQVNGTAPYGRAAHERSISGAVQPPIEHKIVVHSVGSSSTTDNLYTV